MSTVNLAVLDLAVRRARDRRRLPTPATRRLIRIRAGVRQREIANAVGVTRECVAQWERGRCSPRGERLAAYLAVLDRLAAEGKEHGRRC